MVPAPQRTAAAEADTTDLHAEPAAAETVQVADVRRELRQAAHTLQECGLAHSACWAAEQLGGLRQDDGDDGAAPASPPQPAAGVADSGALLLAKAYFEAKVCKLC